MKLATIAVLLCAATSAFGQLTVVGSSPAANATSVPLSTTISVTFSEAVDTSSSYDSKDRVAFTNLDGIIAAGFSPDKRTFSWEVSLQADKVYFVCVYYASAAGGGTLSEPYAFSFTTGASFPPYTVSGSISPGGTGVAPGKAMVMLSLNSVMNQEPRGAAGAIADADGNFSIPYVGNGTYWPVAAKDANGDGRIDPGMGDAIAFGDSIIVNNASIAGLVLVLQKFEPLGFRAAVDSAQLYANSLPQDRSLRLVQAWGPTPQGVSTDWQFHYISPSSTPPGYSIYLRPERKYVTPIEEWTYDWIHSMAPVGDLGLAADASTFLSKVEASGGLAFRTKPIPDSLEFDSYIMLGDLQYSELWSLISDPTKRYWGAVYMIAKNLDSTQRRYEEMKFLGDYSTGDILGVASVDPSGPPLHPEHIALEQNYPNPFNPATTIMFSLPHRVYVRLEIFNALGQEVASLVNGFQEAGQYEVRWNASDAPSGVYFYKLTAGSFSAIRKLMLVK
jgi:hypothetical protein